ncbi:sulfurtransferase [Alcaligenaceae bacterium 429]|nr:sulfurtransferase [Alcaligenaceae bacterium 429]
MTQPTQMNAEVSVAVLRQWLADGSEIALLDVREHGQYGSGHLFYAVNAPYSVLEHRVPYLVPRRTVRIVLYAQGGDIARQAQQLLQDIGYTQVYVLAGGVKAWQQAGHNVFAGVNVPSKTFGELVEQHCHTPHIKAEDLAASQAAAESLLLLDGRPFEEYQKKTIPGAICCPNGELALRATTLMRTANAARIVVNCAGRTRSIIGAQTLINLGVPYEVVALENGTQGWFLEGLVLEQGAMRDGEAVQPDNVDVGVLQQQAQRMAQEVGVKLVTAAQLQQWLAESHRTTYVCDVRTTAEYTRNTLRVAKHTPGGQLVQATDHYIGTRGARIVLWDDLHVRSWVTASWLLQMGWDVTVLERDAGALLGCVPGVATDDLVGFELPHMTVEQLAASVRHNAAQLIDIRPSQQYRAAHLRGAQWSIRPHLRYATLKTNQLVVVIASDPYSAALAAKELQSLGVQQVCWHHGTTAQWLAAGLVLENSPDQPADDDCIDYVFFAHDRHEGNRQAALQYLAWETNLLQQVDELELQYFKVYVAP